MKGGRKAQISLEFLIVTALVLLVFIVMGIVLYQKYADWSALSLHVTGRNIANNLAESVNQVTTVGEGYSQYLELHTRFPGDEFNITFMREDPVVFVEREMNWHAPLLTTEVYCCLDICRESSDRVVMTLNSSLKTKVINYQNKIYVGRTCASTTTTTPPAPLPPVAVSRTLPQTEQAGNPFTVTLHMEVNDDPPPASVGIRERYPPGWSVSGISPCGSIIGDHIEWLFTEAFPGCEVQTQDVSYQVTAPSPGTEVFSGTVYYGVTDPITGDETVMITT